MYFRCSVKLSPCITKYLENVFLQLSQFLSKFEQNFSDKPGEGKVTRVGIYCDGSCNPNDRYFTVGVEKLKEIEKLRKADSRTYVKTRTTLVCGDKNTENPKEQSNKMNSDRDLEKGLEFSEDFDNSAVAIESNPVISSDVPIKQKNEDGKFKVKLKMSVVGKIEEMQLENELEGRKPAKDIENLENAKLENELKDEKPAKDNKNLEEAELENELKEEKPAKDIKNLEETKLENELKYENPAKEIKNLEETKLENELEDKKSAENITNKEDLSPTNDETIKENRKSIVEEQVEGAKSDEIEIDISWFEDNQHVLENYDPGAESHLPSSDSEKSLENSKPYRKRTSSQNEYQRFINEFADFSYGK